MATKLMIQLVEDLKGTIPIGEICRHLGVGRSSYYHYLPMEEGCEPSNEEGDSGSSDWRIVQTA